MTNKQIAFIENYLSNGLNATQACISAGYSKKTAMEQGYQLLQNTSVKDEIAKRQAVTAKKLEVKKEDLIQDLIDIKNTNKETEPMISIKAIETINKMLGLNASEKSEVTIKQEQPLFLPLDKQNE